MKRLKQLKYAYTGLFILQATYIVWFVWTDVGRIIDFTNLNANYGDSLLFAAFGAFRYACLAIVIYLVKKAWEDYKELREKLNKTPTNS